MANFSKKVQKALAGKAALGEVYLIDQNTRTKNRLTDAQEFDALADTWWGDDPKFQARKIAICHQAWWG